MYYKKITVLLSYCHATPCPERLLAYKAFPKKLKN